MQESSPDKLNEKQVSTEEVDNKQVSTEKSDKNHIETDELIVTAFSFYGIMLVGSMVLSFVFKGNLFLWPGSLIKLAIGIGAGIFVGVSVALISRILIRFPRWKKLFSGFKKILGHLDKKDAFILALMSATGEEAFFRGLLQPWLGIPFTSFLFAVLHAPQIFNKESEETSDFALWPWFALIIGIMLGWLAQYTGTWISSAVAHMVINYLNLVYICSQPSLENETNR